MKISHIKLVFKLFLLFMAAGLLIFSCNLFNLEKLEETADVRVSIEKDRNNTALIPDIESMVEAYSVTLSRDGYEDRTVYGDQNQSQYNFSDVPVGEWGVEVLAHDGSVEDENTLVIAEGSDNLDVTTSAQSSIEITVEP